MAHANMDKSHQNILRAVMDSYMVRAPGAREEADRCLAVNRWEGSPLLMVLDVAFTSVGLGYFRSVVPAVQHFCAWGKICTLEELQSADTDTEYLRKFWKNRRSWEVAGGIASHLVELQEERELHCERDALACWAREARPETWKDDPVGRIRGVGLGTFQYLRMNGGVDTVMPDKIVRRVVGSIFRDAGMEMKEYSDLELIEKVKELGQATGYRPLDICWMCWLISVACPSREKVDAVL
jgi:hypothetical protein